MFEDDKVWEWIDDADFSSADYSHIEKESDTYGITGVIFLIQAFKVGLAWHLGRLFGKNILLKWNASIF